jgi:hypothetical protein
MSSKKSAKKKLHPWRVCSIGEHWVSPHTVNRHNKVIFRRGHCRANSSRKDQLYPEEMNKIFEEQFSNVKRLPSSDNLGKKNGNNYDAIIAGWTQYWNEVLKPTEELDPNLVKALIFTESTFNVDAKALASKGNWARGLMQITDETIKILKSEKGELKNFLVNLDENKAKNPNLNISAGIRWLFHKKHLLEKKLKRSVTWHETIMEYKSYTKGLKNKNQSAIRQKNKFEKTYKRLKK